MARINIEDKFWLEIVPLAIALGDQDRAVGMAVRFFRVAQESHKAGKLISEAEFSRSFHESMIGAFAERVDGGVRAMGAEKHFGWLAKRVEAGRKGGSKRKQTKANESKTRKGKQTQPSPSPSPSSSFSSSDSDSSSFKNTLRPAVAVAEKTPVVHYCDEYKARYGHSPVIGGKQAGLINTFAKNHPSRWRDLICGYLQLPDPWLAQRSHPVESLDQKVNEIERFLKTGKVVTRKVAEHLEELTDKAQGTNRRPRKSAEELARERDPNYVPSAQPKLVSGGDA